MSIVWISVFDCVCGICCLIVLVLFVCGVNKKIWFDGWVFCVYNGCYIVLCFRIVIMIFLYWGVNGLLYMGCWGMCL